MHSSVRRKDDQHIPKCGQMLVMILIMGLSTLGHAQSSRFDVFHGKKVVGEVQAHRQLDGHRTHYIMTSQSEFWILWTQTMRSYAETDYVNGQLHACNTSFRLNGSLRDSSSMTPNSGVHHCYIEPEERFIHQGSVDWTTARMYFEEPLGLNSIFVESALKHCPLKLTSPHTYRLELPDGNVNSYMYQNGVLQEIIVERRFVDLVFRRA